MVSAATYCFVSYYSFAVQVDPPSGNDKFIIYASSGEIYLAQSLDYESVKQYILTIQAKV